MAEGETLVTKRDTPIILVVEDYPDTRHLLSALLRSKGYMVVEAGDGKEGMLQANRVNPDLILMDLALPELDGVEATRQLRQRHMLSQTPIFAISAFATSDVARDAHAFVDRWRPRVEAMMNARHRGMLRVILGETLEQKRFFEQALAGRTDLLGKRAEQLGPAIGEVLPTRWIE